MKANTLQYEIDKYFESYGFYIADEYAFSNSVALFEDPYNTMLEQKEMLNTIFKE